MDTFRKFKWFTLGLIIIFPLYPSLSLIWSGGIARAWDYDESTIITAYNDLDNLEDDGYISDTGFIRVGGWSDGRNISVSEVSKETKTSKKTVKKHIVKSRESIRSISDVYGVSTDAILWANDLEKNDELKIGQVLKIPPVSGVVHTVVSGDTISVIASKYKVSVPDIVSVNMLRDAGSIRIGMDLMIPGAIKHTPSLADTSDKSGSKTPLNKVATKILNVTDTKISPKETEKISPKEPTVNISSKTGLKDRYVVKYTGLSRGFVGWNCTWYVAQNKSVTWRGNASAWMRNARAEGVKTGSTPVVGAIIQFSWTGYNRYYGHVGIVAGIEDGNVIVKDMNYRGLYEVTIRKVPIDHSSIDGYIYVD